MENTALVDICESSGKDISECYCEECCPHDEHDHYVCLDCGKELDPGEFIDHIYDQIRDF